MTATTVRGFPCCVWSPMPTCRRPYPGRSDGACSLVRLHRQRPSLVTQSGRLLQLLFRGLLSVYSRYGLHAHRVTNVTLCTESSDGSVTLSAASVVTRWSEPVPGWELHPLKSSAFHGALFRQLTPGGWSFGYNQTRHSTSSWDALRGRMPAA